MAVSMPRIVYMTTNQYVMDSWFNLFHDALTLRGDSGKWQVQRQQMVHLQKWTAAALKNEGQGLGEEGTLCGSEAHQ